MTHALEMITRIKNNKALNQTRKDRYKKLRSIYLEKVTQSNNQKIIISRKDLKRLRREIKKDLRREQIISMIKPAVISIIIFTLITSLIYYLFFIRDIVLIN